MNVPPNMMLPSAAGATLLQAVRGPLLLIAVGILFAVDHFGPYPVTRTWPVLLILVGVLKLLDRAAGRAS